MAQIKKKKKTESEIKCVKKLLRFLSPLNFSIPIPCLYCIHAAGVVGEDFQILLVGGFGVGEVGGGDFGKAEGGFVGEIVVGIVVGNFLIEQCGF